MKFRKLKKVLARYGIEWKPQKGKGSHGVFVGESHVLQIRQVYPIPASQQKEISQAYIRPLRRKFELTKESGVSDDDFK